MEKKRSNMSLEKQPASINTPYVRTIERQENFKERKRVLLYRRLAIFGVISVVIIGGLISTLFTSNEALEEKQQAKIQVTKELEKVQEEQEILKRQIARLNDDEYIGKLLRKEYFLSEEGEIIFTLPENDGK